jgi:Mg2+ and Co2+ transporter CorA
MSHEMDKPTEELLLFIQEQEEAMDQIGEEMKVVTQEYQALTSEALQLIPREHQEKIAQYQAEIISSLTTILPMASKMIQREETPRKLLEKLHTYIRKAITLLTQYIKIFKIESVEITISMTPSIVITLKQ